MPHPWVEAFVFCPLVSFLCRVEIRLSGPFSGKCRGASPWDKTRAEKPLGKQGRLSCQTGIACSFSRTILGRTEKANADFGPPARLMTYYAHRLCAATLSPPWDLDHARRFLLPGAYQEGAPECTPKMPGFAIGWAPGPSMADLVTAGSPRRNGPKAPFFPGCSQRRVSGTPGFGRPIPGATGAILRSRYQKLGIAYRSQP